MLFFLVLVLHGWNQRPPSYSQMYKFIAYYIYIFRKVALRYKYIAFLTTAKKALIIRNIKSYA